MNRYVRSTSHILDVGCGKDSPFYMNLIQEGIYPERYVGVDICTINSFSNTWGAFHSSLDLTDYKQASFLLKRYGRFDLIIASDILETMIHRNGRILLRQCGRLLSSDGTLLLSTPVREKGSRALDDYSYSVYDLQWLLTELGFKLLKRWGESATYADLQETLELKHHRLLEPMRGYYSDDKLALLLSPLYPGKSKSNIWVCQNVR